MTNSNDSLATGYMMGRDSGNGYNNGGIGWGMDGWWGLIIILALFGYGGFGGGWGGGFGGNNGANAFLPYAVGANGALTRADLCSEFNFNGLENSVRGVQNGICDLGYALNSSILNGFHGVDNAVCNLGYQTAQLANGINTTIMQGNNALQTQLAQCCCDNRAGQAAIQQQISSCCCDIERQVERGFCDVNYNMATNTNALMVQSANNTRDIIDSQRDGTRAILDYLCQEKISDLQNENQALRLAASQERQNNYLVNTLRPTAQPAYLTCNPFTGLYGGYGYNGYGYNGYNNGCGCNNNCGCGCGCNG